MLNEKERFELRTLKRQFGTQPGNFSQAKRTKANDLIDDREDSPTNSPRRAGGKNPKYTYKPEWETSTKTGEVRVLSRAPLSLPKLINNTKQEGPQFFIKNSRGQREKTLAGASVR